MENQMRTTSRVLLGAVLAMTVQTAGAASDFVTGRITASSFVGTTIFIRVDTGLPDNCAGTPFGWMVIPATAKPMAAFVIGLKLRGDLSETGVTVYTTGRDASGYCQIAQIAPVG
jgi:hypothetical protein